MHIHNKPKPKKNLVNVEANTKKKHHSQDLINTPRQHSKKKIPPLCYAYAELSKPALLTLLIGCKVFESTGSGLACLYLPEESLTSIS